MSTAGCPASRQDASVRPRAVRVSPGRPRQSTSDDSSSRCTPTAAHAARRDPAASFCRERQARQRANRRQHQRADRAPVVQGVRVTAALGGEPAEGDAARGQPPQDRRDLRRSSCAGSGSGARRRTTPVASSQPASCQLATAGHGGVQGGERGAPGGRPVCPLAVAVPERTGQARHGLGQAARRGAAVPQDAVDLGQRHRQRGAGTGRSPGQPLHGAPLLRGGGGQR